MIKYIFNQDIVPFRLSETIPEHQCWSLTLHGVQVEDENITGGILDKQNKTIVNRLNCISQHTDK